MSSHEFLEAIVLSFALLAMSVVSIVVSALGFVVSLVREHVSPSKPLRFSSILVTGASAGIGKCLALRYAKPGVFLAITGRNKDRLEETRQQCVARGATVEASSIDVADTDAFSKWIVGIDAKHPLDLVVANAGVSGSSLGIERAFEDKAREMYEINVKGVMNTILPILPQIRDRRRGHIVVLSSLAGIFAPPASAAYAATKADVYTFCQHTRENLRRDNVRVSVVCPGYVESNLTSARRKLGGAMPFFMSTEKAVDIITSGIDQNKFLIAFPFPMYALTWALRSLPSAMLGVLYRVVNPNKSIKSWNEIG